MPFLKDGETHRRAVRLKEILEMYKNKSNTILHDEIDEMVIDTEESTDMERRKKNCGAF